MNHPIKISELDVFYLSYDEPNCEENWADLKSKVPWAKRVHGVKGFDNAHKECARQSETERFITVDGDNTINEKFIDLVIYVPEECKNAVFSWGSRNVVNGLIYGNGGIKCWPTDAVMHMKTHENSPSDRPTVDFCWDLDYVQMNSCFSTTHINGSEYQAFRAGFREGVKMGLLNGDRLSPEHFLEYAPEGNIKRLIIWCSVGMDVMYGGWAIFGALMGCSKCNLDESWDYTRIHDYDWFANEINPMLINCIAEKETNFSREEIYQDWLEVLQPVADNLRTELGLKISILSPKISEFFKQVYENPLRGEFNIEERFE